MKRLILTLSVLIIFSVNSDAKWPAVNSNVPGVDGQILYNNNGNVGARDGAIDTRSVIEDGALCNGVHDDTAAIQATIDYCLTNGCKVFIPPVLAPVTNGCRVTQPLIMTTAPYYKSFAIVGAQGATSRLLCQQADDCIRVINASNTTIRDLYIIMSSPSAKWGINCTSSPNMIIDNVHMGSVQLTGALGFTGSISLNSCYSSRITSNLLSVYGQNAIGIYAYNSSNVLFIAGNRLDGAMTNTGGYGMYLIGAGLSVTGNTIESFLVCVELAALSGFHFEGNYTEFCGTNIRAKTSYLNGGTINGNFFSTYATNLFPIDIQYGTNLTIQGNSFTSHPISQSNGKYVAINANYSTNRDWTVGPNSLHYIIDQTPPYIDQEIALYSGYAEKNIDVFSVHQFYSGKNILQDSFESWPTTTAAPGPWRYFVTAPVKVAESPFGRYSVQIGEPNTGILIYPYPLISTTVNAGMHGQIGMFCVYLKLVAGFPGFHVNISDGVGSTQLDFPLTSSWVRACTGFTIDAAATALSIILSNNGSGGSSFLVASPGLWFGTTLPQTPIASPAWLATAGPLIVDADTHSSSGAGSQQLVGISIPANTVGNSTDIHIHAVGTVTGTNAAKSVSIVYGGTTLTSLPITAPQQLDWSLDVLIQNLRDSTQRIVVIDVLGSTVFAFDYLTAAVDNSSVAATLEVRANPVNSGDVVSVTYFRVDMGF